MRPRQAKGITFLSGLFKMVQEATVAVEFLGLEAARQLALETLAELQLDLRGVDRIRRKLAQAESKDGFLQNLLLVAAELAWQHFSARAMGEYGGSPSWSPLVASKLDRSRLIVVPVESILYAFVGQAASTSVIDAPWRQQESLHPRRVYLRTIKELLVTHYRSLAELQERLDPLMFMSIHQSLVVNVHRISSLDTEGSLKRVVVTPVGRIEEWLTISRRHFPELRDRLGLPRRFNAGE